MSIIYNCVTSMTKTVQSSLADPANQLLLPGCGDELDVPCSESELRLNCGFEPYNACTPSTSSTVRRTFFSRGLMLGYMTARGDAEWPSPRTWPISCVATDSRSMAAAVASTSKSTAQCSDASRWSRPFFGEKAWPRMPSGPSNGTPSPWLPA
uniref:Uncharacterized protein n=1 Tax=Oryza punctata TaxID=4537 RepID=A0A0E0MAM1_ORYPU